MEKIPADGLLDTEVSNMKVLHDWDRLVIDGGWVKRRFISLLFYGLCAKFKFLRKIKYLQENAEKLEAEQIEYMLTLIKLNQLCGVKPIFGIRDEIRERYDKEINELAEKHDLDVRRHIHIGKDTDPDRKRTWNPPLTQSRDTWHFGTSWVNGNPVPLKPNELPIFHVDRPQYLKHYIDYLYEILIEDTE